MGRRWPGLRILFARLHASEFALDVGQAGDVDA